MMNKMMKKAVIMLAAATMALSTASVAYAEQAQNISQIKQEQKATLNPHWFPILDDNGKVFDGTWHTDLDTSTIKDVDGGFTIEAKFFGIDEYPAGEVNNLKKGDTILYDENMVTVDTVDNKENGCVLVNGGFDEGGITFIPSEGGAYITRIDNDFNTFEKMAEGTVFVSDKTVLIDRSDLSNKDGVKYTGAKEIKEFMTDSNRHMNLYNTILEFENGELKEIDINYVP